MVDGWKVGQTNMSMGWQKNTVTHEQLVYVEQDACVYMYSGCA